MSKKRKTRQSSQKYDSHVSVRKFDYSKAYQPDLLRPELRIQRELKVARLQENPLRHAAEYLKYVRKQKPMATSMPKIGPMDEKRMAREARLLECKRRKARREVMHAKGHAGKSVKYPDRKPRNIVKC